MIACLRVLTVVSVLLVSACSSTFSKTWRDPKATPLEFKGQKVAAVVLVKDESLRRLAENRLAQQIAARGAQGRPMYSLAPNATYGDEQGTRAALEREGVKGVIVMRPIKIDKTVKIKPAYEDSNYVSLWGGYYGYGFSASFTIGSTEPTVSENIVVYVETLVYSLTQNRLVWAGQSKSQKPDTVAELIEKLSQSITDELKSEDLIGK